MICIYNKGGTYIYLYVGIFIPYGGCIYSLCGGYIAYIADRVTCM